MMSSAGACRSVPGDQATMKVRPADGGNAGAGAVLRSGSVARLGSVRAWIGVALAFGAFAAFEWGPWRGPIILSLSSTHGIDAGDIPAFALLAVAVAVAGWAPAQDARQAPRLLVSRWAIPASALALGALLLAGVFDIGVNKPLVPAGGGTFGGATQHADARAADPVNRWSHVAVTYDGTALRLFENSTQVSSRAITGSIRRTADPLWIGGSHPYGEYFRGLIDEVRVYDRALSPSEIRAEMSTPIRSARITRAPGLVGAYGFDGGSQTVAADASGKGNAGAITGASFTTGGRFGGALRFHDAGDLVRVPPSSSLNLKGAMTLSAWIEPTQSQAGWRTVLHRQTDAYFLMAGGGGDNTRLGRLDDTRVALLFCGALWFCLAWSCSPRRAGDRRRSWWVPVALFLAGSAVDAALSPAATLIGPTAVAIWYALTASDRVEAAILYLIGAGFMGVTLIALVGPAGLELGREDGGVARSAAVGLLLVT